ncbi:hypothetical protein BH20VER3_BH20VER3_07760 [soil metagenome]
MRAFQEAARLDPNCATAYWGEALVLGPNINAPMSEEAGTKAWGALQKAQAAAPKVSAREQAYIAVLAKRYVENNPQDRHALDVAYAVAMREVMKKNILTTPMPRPSLPRPPWTKSWPTKKSTRSRRMCSRGRVSFTSPRSS